MSDTGIKVVGITGPIAAGKTTIAREVFSKKGYHHYSIGWFIKDIVTKGLFEDEFPIVKKYRSENPTRQNLLDFGKEMRKTYGNDIFIKLILEDAKAHGYEKIVIDGIRGETEIRALQRLGGITIYLDANVDILYKRYVERNKDIDNGSKDFNTFMKMLAEEENSFGIFSSRDANNFIYDNNKSLEEAIRDFNNLL